jgi:hypothetical protein
MEGIRYEGRSHELACGGHQVKVTFRSQVGERFHLVSRAMLMGSRVQIRTIRSFVRGEQTPLSKLDTGVMVTQTTGDAISKQTRHREQVCPV